MTCKVDSAVCLVLKRVGMLERYRVDVSWRSWCKNDSRLYVHIASIHWRWRFNIPLNAFNVVLDSFADGKSFHFIIGVEYTRCGIENRIVILD